jgi:hypothetical protein
MFNMMMLSMKRDKFACLTSIVASTIFLLLISKSYAQERPSCSKTSRIILSSDDVQSLSATETSPRHACFTHDELGAVVLKYKKRQAKGDLKYVVTHLECSISLLENKLAKTTKRKKNNVRISKQIKFFEEIAQECQAPIKLPTPLPTLKPGDVFVPHPKFSPSPNPLPTGVSTNVPVVSPTSTSGTSNPPVIVNPVELDEVIKKGIAAFKSPDKGFPRVNCTSCHAPDGFDLAMINYSDETLRRRASPHVDAAKTEEIVKLVHALRQKYAIVNPPSPETFRPFQPGGEVLKGSNTLDKDLEYAKSLEQVYNLRVTQNIPIRSLAEARQAQAQILAIDMSAMKIGISFNRWTEDGFNGATRDTLADWIPDIPFVIRAGKEAELQSLENQYLSDSSDANFAKLYDFTLREVEALTPGTGGLEEIALAKKTSSLVAHHLFRKTYLNKKPVATAFNVAPHTAVGQWYYDTLQQNAQPVPRGQKVLWKEGNFANPFWRFGDLARTIESPPVPCSVEVHNSCINVPESLWNKFFGNNSITDQMKVIRIPWFWLGFIWDQGLQRSGGSNSTKSAEYMIGALFDAPDPSHPIIESTKNSVGVTEGFPTHRTFMYMRKTMVEATVKSAYENTSPRFPRTLGYFWGYNRDQLSVTNAEKEGYNELAQRVRVLISNFYLMNLYLLEHELSTLKSLDGSNSDIAKTREYYTGGNARFTSWFNFVGGSYKTLADPIIARVANLVNTLPGDSN